MQPIILHLDMNSYFATVEQQDNPAWRGQVLGVCEHLGGIIIAASIEAKKWGIKTGTPVWEAKKIYPKIILTHTRAEAYRKYNRLVTKVVSDYTDKVEVASIDEVVMDITKATNIKISNNKFQISNETNKSQSAQLATNNLQLAAGYVNPWEEAVKIAKEIKRRMKTEVGDYLTCSIGIADNKLLAKIGSDLQKPDGLVIISNEKFSEQGRSLRQISPPKADPPLAENRTHSEHSDANSEYSDRDGGIVSVSKDDLYTKLKLTDIPGIGKRMEKSLNALGIRTLLDLKNYPQRLLEVKFGINGRHLYNMGQLNGSWRAKVQGEEEIKSIGHMYTLPAEYRQAKFFVPVLYKLCEMVGRRMRKKNLAGNIIHFYVRDKNYESFGESKKLDCFISDGREIFLQAINIYERLKIKTGETKLIGITVAGLSPALHQQSLFPQEEKHSQVAGALDKINQKYGDFTVCRVPVLAAAKVFRDSVGFGRVKEL